MYSAHDNTKAHDEEKNMLPIAYSLYYSLPVAHCLLPIAYCRLPIAKCLDYVR